MNELGQILALDLAARAGWACGRVVDRVPESGSVQFAKTGASMAAVLSGCRTWLDAFLIQHPRVQLVVFESPLISMHMVGKTNTNTIRQLVGLAAVVEELLYSKSGYDIREARVSDIRTHFLGSNRHKRAQAKALTLLKCRAAGWDPVDDNAADAQALWDYQASLLKK